MNASTISLLLFLALTATALAEAPLGSDAAVREAVASNPRIATARSQWQAFLERVPQARSLEDPMLTVTSYHGPAYNIPFHRTMDNDLGISQKIPGPHKRRLRAEVAGHDAEAARATYLETIRDIVARTRSSFANYLAAYHVVKVLHEEARILDDLARLTELHYSVGHGSHHDALRASVELLNVRNEERTTQGEQEAARAQLAALMHRPAGTTLPEPAGEVTPALPPALDTLIARARRERPLLLSGRSMVASSRSALALARRERSPDYTVMLEHQFQDIGPDTYNLQVSINLPFLVKKKYASAIREARQRVSAAEQTLDADETDALSDVMAAYARTTSLAQTLAAYRPIIALSDEAVSSSLAAYEVGQTDFLNVLESQRTRRIAWTEYYRMYGQYMEAWAQLEKAVGTDIAPAGPVPAQALPVPIPASPVSPPVIEPAPAGPTKTGGDGGDGDP